MTNIVEVKNLSLVYHMSEGETKAIDDITFDIKEKDFVSIIGPSGCGKTTILNMLSGILKPSSGYINIKKQSPDPMIAGYMLQHDNLFEWLSIKKNIMLGLKIQKKYNDKTKNFAIKLLKKYGLYEYADYKPSQLSGGMRQRVALIRTLVLSPEILLLDEPFSALDYQTRLILCDDVLEIIKTEKKTAVLVTHDISEAISMSDKIIILTKRPAKIAEIYNLDFDKDLSPLKRRENQQFGLIFDQIWNKLQNEKTEN